jgi:membrane protein implicated in regulation of membrane protease activity
MIILGPILLIAEFLLGIPLLTTVGVIVLVVGVVGGRTIGGRRPLLLIDTPRVDVGRAAITSVAT